MPIIANSFCFVNNFCSILEKSFSNLLSLLYNQGKKGGVTMNEHIRIRERRKALNLSQDDLAKALGFKSRSAIAHIETGENKINAEKVNAFAIALQTSPEYIMGITDNPKPTHYTATTPQERQLLAAYRHASDEGKKVFHALTAYFLPPTE
jgi:transcriptional regulator with XRE-family HTH domain